MRCALKLLKNGLFLIRAVDVRHWTEILVGKDEKPAFGAAHGQEIEDAGHLGQGAKLIETRQGALPLDIPLKSSEIWNPEFRSQKPEWSARGFASFWLLASGFWLNS